MLPANAAVCGVSWGFPLFSGFKLFFESANADILVRIEKKIAVCIAA